MQTKCPFAPQTQTRTYHARTYARIEKGARPKIPWSIPLKGNIVKAKI